MIERERYVPRRARQLTQELAARPRTSGGSPPVDGDDPGRFESFARLVAALYHFQFHEREQEIVELWELIGSDAPAAERFSAELRGLLEGANYEPLTHAQLVDALDHESLLKLRLEVDLDDYAELIVYRRGTHVDTVELRRWKGLRSPEQRSITVDERVVVHTRVKPAEWFASRGVDPRSRNLEAGHVSLKQFENVPRADIEMLLPSTRVKFRPVDRLLVGVPAVLSGVVVLATKLLPTLGLIVLLFAAWLGLRDEQPELDQAALVVLATGLVTIGVFVVRQWTKLKNRRIEYWKTLTENLYFRTLGNGPGVLHDLLASAEEQEVVEVLLGYRFLLDEPRGASPDELDRRIEAWLHDDGLSIDFEIDDAVDKLRRLGVITGGDRLLAMPLPEALEHLDRRWDDLFRFHP